MAHDGNLWARVRSCTKFHFATLRMNRYHEIGIIHFDIQSMDISRYHSMIVDVILLLTLVIPDLFVLHGFVCNFELLRFSCEEEKTATQKCMTSIGLLIYTNFRFNCRIFGGNNCAFRFDFQTNCPGV